MKGIWLEDLRIEFREDLPEPEPGPEEALVRVDLAGVCNTDLELVKGYYPFTGIPGHEFVGTVLESPEKSLIGKRVVGEINIPCGNCICIMCSKGLGRHCLNRSVLGITNHNGAFAEKLSLATSNLITIPDNIENRAACFTEPLAAALEIAEQMNIEKGRSIYVVGDGKLGILIGQAMAGLDARVTMLGRNPVKEGFVNNVGLDWVHFEAVDDRSSDFVIECTGNPEGFKTALRVLRPRGTLVMKSTYKGTLDMDASSIVVDEINIIGSRCGPFKPALDMLASGNIQIESLITGCLPMSKGVKAFELAAEKNSMKVLIDPSC